MQCDVSCTLVSHSIECVDCRGPRMQCLLSEWVSARPVRSRSRVRSCLACLRALFHSACPISIINAYFKNTNSENRNFKNVCEFEIFVLGARGIQSYGEM